MNPIFKFIGSSIISGLIMSMIHGQKDDYWYDFYHKYYSFPKEMTDSIDRMLINMNPTHSMIGKIKIITPHHYIPDHGNHYYFPNAQDHPFQYIGMYKKYEIIGSAEIYRYIAWVSPFYSLLINDFSNKILTKSDDDKSIDVFTIDTSTMEPQYVCVQKIYKQPTSLQISIIDQIINHWQHFNNNTKVFLHGPSGIGKTFTSYGLKKELEKLYKCNVVLYDDFNPTVIGLSVHKILANARID